MMREFVPAPGYGVPTGEDAHSSSVVVHHCIQYGLMMFGPFKSEESAVEWARKEMHSELGAAYGCNPEGGHWFITHMQRPTVYRPFTTTKKRGN